MTNLPSPYDEFSLQAWKADQDESASTLSHYFKMGFFISWAALYPLTAAIMNHAEASVGEALITGAMMSGGIALLATLILMGFVVGPRVEKKSAFDKVGNGMPRLFTNLWEEFDAILKLRPPADALQEVLSVQAATNQVIESYFALQRIAPKDDLSHSSPVKWLENTLEQLKTVRSKLEEARFEAYVESLPPVSMDRSLDSIQSERDFVASVLNRGAQDGLDAKLEEDLTGPILRSEASEENVR